MKLVIEINLDNEAFEDGEVGEVARILSDLGGRLDAMSPGVLHSLLDVNGNRVGSAEIKD